jgi:uncharacterized protein YcaQ
VEARGPLTARELEVAIAHDTPRDRDRWGWNWSAVKRSVEYLFWAGQISAAGRTSQFERRYASLAAVAPPAVRDRWVDPARRPLEDDAILELVRIAAKAHGVGTELCLRDYFRLKSVQVRPAITRLVETGELEPVEIVGWPKPAWIHAEARVPRRLHAEALLSPFDSLVWQRERTEVLYDLRYRIEIYTPQHQRVHGYYVLPFLYGDELVARVDLKADRTAGVLRLNQATWQPDAPAEARPALLRNLASMADWLVWTTVSSNRSPHDGTPGRRDVRRRGRPRIQAWAQPPRARRGPSRPGRLDGRRRRRQPDSTRHPPESRRRGPP